MFLHPRSSYRAFHCATTRGSIYCGQCQKSPRLLPSTPATPLDTPQSRSGAHLARPHHEHADAHALVVQLGRFRQRACDLLQIPQQARGDVAGCLARPAPLLLLAWRHLDLDTCTGTVAVGAAPREARDAVARRAPPDSSPSADKLRNAGPCASSDGAPRLVYPPCSAAS